MKKLIKVSVVVLLLLIEYHISAQTITIFTDNFANFSKISASNNIIVAITNVVLKNYTPGSNGFLISKTITKATNEKWLNLNVYYKITNTLPFSLPSINLMISDTNNLVQLYPNTAMSSSSLDLTTINPLSPYNNIKLKFTLIAGQSGNPGTPILQSYSVTVNKVNPSLSNQTLNSGFYGVPSPLLLAQTPSIRFYYAFSTATKVNLKIYDTNYNLIKNILLNQSYATGTTLDATWDGKNGNNNKVMSGVYIAVFDLSTSTGTSTQTFKFAIIR